MKDPDWRWEVVRVLVGVGLVVGFGWMLWKQTLEPALEKNFGGSGVRLKAREKFLEWNHERRMERRRQEVLEEEKRRREEEERSKSSPAPGHSPAAPSEPASAPPKDQPK
jgi:hypothetical protein